MKDMLRYSRPSEEWISGLPIGNGRLAAMFHGDKEKDILTLNNEWLWRGLHREKPLEDRSGRLSEVRSLLLQGDFAGAGILANELYGGKGGTSGEPGRVDAYQVAGELSFSLPGRNFCSSALDISDGIAEVCREGDIKGEFFASCIGGGIYAKYSSPIHFDIDLALSRCDDPYAKYCKTAFHEGSLTLACGFTGGISFEISANITTDGTVVPDGSRCRIKNATSVEVFCDITTDARPGSKAEFLPYSQERRAHTEKFSAAMNGFSLELDSARESDLTTDARMEAVRNGAEDTGLGLLYFNYGRYLLYSSSILGELPANLQGKWNNMTQPPWESDYHFDINLEMNYWGAEALGMPECVDALVTYLLSFMPSAREAAKKLYGCKGIYLPLQTDAWGISTPEAKGWAVWIGAAAWMAQHIWRHYTYSGDVGFLRERAYGFLKAVAEFYEDYLVDIDGRLEILPSQSPENRFEGGGDLPVSICISSAMDVQLAYDALTYAADAASILGVDAKQAEKWLEMRSKLPPFAIGSDGRLLEWRQEFSELEPGHRHLSHLYGLYPGNLFTPKTNPEQYAAAIRSLRSRLSYGGGHTGWSRAWVSALMARIGDSDGFNEHYTALVVDFATDSLLDTHPGPHGPLFQIDGNFGGIAAVSEALASAADGEVRLLHALPSSWLVGGRVKGMRLEGGHRLDFEWKDARVTDLCLTVGYSQHAELYFNGVSHSFNGRCGEVIHFQA